MLRVELVCLNSHDTFVCRRPRSVLVKGALSIRTTVDTASTTRGRCGVSGKRMARCVESADEFAESSKLSLQDVVLLEKPQDDPSGEWWDHVTKAGKPECRVV